MAESESLTIVMYHYVRKIKGSQFPKIKGLEFEAFKRQLDYLEKRYNLIKASQMIEYFRGGVGLPTNACLLSFDDGYKDHIKYVMPELMKRKIQGSFFPPVKSILEREMLEVNSIQFILESCSDYEMLIFQLNRCCLENNISQSQLDKFWCLYGVASRCDIKEVMYLKSILQYALPAEIRSIIVKKLFKKYVSTDSKAFSEDLYLSVDDTRKLVENDMYVGSHGYRHLWLNKEPKESQKLEIDCSLNFLADIGASTNDWIMCYPFGAYNNETLEILRGRRCAVGLTTRVGVADLDSDSALELPRLDTNDFLQ